MVILGPARAVVLVAILLGLSRPAAAADRLSAAALTQRLDQAVLFVVARGQDKSGKPGISIGSGFLIANDLVLTNRHVVAEAPAGKVIVIHRTAGPLAASIIGTAGNAKDKSGDDFALLRIPPLRNATPLTLATTYPPLTQVVSAGFPGAVIDSDLAFQNLLRGKGVSAPNIVLTSGEISSIQSGLGAERVFHTATISQGNSGGPAVDRCGRVVAINTLGIAEPGEANRFIGLSTRALQAFLATQRVNPSLDASPCPEFDDRTAPAVVAPVPSATVAVTGIEAAVQAWLAAAQKRDGEAKAREETAARERALEAECKRAEDAERARVTAESEKAAREAEAEKRRADEARTRQEELERRQAAEEDERRIEAAVQAKLAEIRRQQELEEQQRRDAAEADRRRIAEAERERLQAEAEVARRLELERQQAEEEQRTRQAEQQRLANEQERERRIAEAVEARVAELQRRQAEEAAQQRLAAEATLARQTATSAAPAPDAPARPDISSEAPPRDDRGPSVAMVVPPRPEPEIDPIGRDYTVLRDVVVREQPSTQSNRLGVLATGETVRVVGRVRAGGWLQVERQARVLGYVAERALAEAGATPKATAQVAAAVPAPAAPTPPAAPAVSRAPATASAFLQEQVRKAQDMFGADKRADDRANIAAFRASILESAFDVRTMATFVLGAAGSRIGPETLAEFTAAFADYMVYAYWAHLRKAFGSRVDIRSARMQDGTRLTPITDWTKVPADKFVVVDVTVTDRDGQRTDVQWQAIRRGDDWRVVDVSASGVSLLRLHKDDIGSQLVRNGGDVRTVTIALRDKVRLLSRSPL